MKLIKWLLSNIILIAFVLALTYAYVYWDNLTGEDTPAGKAIAYLSVEYDEVREFLDSYDFGDDEAGEYVEPEPVAQTTETASVPQVMPPPEARTQPSAQPQAMPEAVTQQPPLRQTAQPRVMTQPPPVRRPAPNQMVTQQPPVQQPARPQVPPQAMMQEPRALQPVPPAREPMTRQAPAQPSTAADEPAISTRELWISAREEYYRGNIDASIRNYQQVIANTSDNYDAYGELGNVYLSRGRNREAASAYFEAASILVKQGQVRRARSLLPMLDRLDRSRAQELNQLINESST